MTAKRQCHCPVRVDRKSVRSAAPAQAAKLLGRIVRDGMAAVQVSKEWAKGLPDWVVVSSKGLVQRETEISRLLKGIVLTPHRLLSLFFTKIVGTGRATDLAQRVNNFQIASGFSVFRSQHAHRGEVRDTPFAVAVETSQEEHWLAGDIFDTRLSYGDARFLREGQCDRLPNHCVDFIVLAWEFRDGKLAVLFPDGSLGPRAAKRGARCEQQAQFLIGVFLFHHMFGCGEQFREIDQRRDTLDAFLSQEGAALFFREAQRALTGLVVNQQQEVDFPERARRSALALRAPAFHAAHERSPPTVGRGVADGAEHGRVCRRVKRAGANLQGWLQRESRRMFQPCLVVFEGGAFLVLAHTRPQTPHQVGGAVEVHVYENLSVHHLSFVRFGLRATRMRCGRFSSSSCRPTGSFFGAARSLSRSAIPSTKRTVAYIPIATPGSPFSSLTRVVRLIEARCAAMAAGMRRRRRASRMSRPSLRRACLTGSGIMTDDRLVLISNVQNNGR